MLSTENDVFKALKKEFEQNGGFEKSLAEALEYLLKNNKSRKDTIGRSYIVSYPTITDYFAHSFWENKFSFLTGCALIYEWMPCAIWVNDGNAVSDAEYREIRECLWNLRGDDPERILRFVVGDGMGHLEKLVLMLHNSPSGMSKMLHFINPSIFPIFDSNVCSKLRVSCKVRDLSDVKVYAEFTKGFLKYCNEVVFGADLSGCNTVLRERFGYPETFKVSLIRAIDLALFYSKKESSSADQ